MKSCKETIAALTLALLTGGSVKAEAGNGKGWVDSVLTTFTNTDYVLYPTPHHAPGTEGSMMIYLPDEYYRNPAKRYPVIYYLHGKGTNQREGRWMMEWIHQAIREGRLQPLIVVSPQALPKGYYMNGRTECSTVNTGPVEDVIIQDLIPYVDAHYRTIASRLGRAVEGFSMGGRGSMFFAFKYPELFCAASGLAPAVVHWDTQRKPNDQEETSGPASDPMSEQHFEASHPLVFAKKNAMRIARDVQLRFYVGTADHLKETVSGFCDSLRTLGISNTLQLVEGAHHNPREVFTKEKNPYDVGFWNHVFRFDHHLPDIHVDSNILGLCDTGNKTTLKRILSYTHGPGDINLYHYDEQGKRVVYENQKEIAVPLQPVAYQGQAVIDLGNVDDRLIDDSNATIRLVNGNTYYADEFILKATRLKGGWKNGKTTYTLDTGDIVFNTWGYDTSRDFNSDREWSIMGGDGNGVYQFTLQLEGLRYDGQELPPVTFPAAVYCYGRSCTDLAQRSVYRENSIDDSYTAALRPSQALQWSWHTEGRESMADKPYMNDLYTDYFSLTWPEGTDAVTIPYDSVSVTLHSRYGDSYRLSELTPYGDHELKILRRPTETVFCVAYQQWAASPVYSTLTIAVHYNGYNIVKSWPIASVGAGMTMTGGGGADVDHALTCYNYHGIGNISSSTALNPDYTLSTEIDGITYFYAEDSDGRGYLIQAEEDKRPMQGPPMAKKGKRVLVPDGAWTGDGTDIWHLAALGNVVFVETRMDDDDEQPTLEMKTVGGKEILFKRNINATLNTRQMLERGAFLEEGYNTVHGGSAQWAWTMRYQSGWTTAHPQPNSIPYVNGYYPYGFLPGKDCPIYHQLKNKVRNEENRMHFHAAQSGPIHGTGSKPH